MNIQFKMDDLFFTSFVKNPPINPRDLPVPGLDL